MLYWHYTIFCLLMPSRKKKRVALFSLTCDEGCSIALSEIFNEKLIPWLQKMEIVYFLALKKGGETRDLDIALIEGVIASPKEKAKVEDIRANAKVVIAIGMCAINGYPSGQRNTFNEEQKREVQADVERLKYLDRCLSVKEVIRVDDEVSGCPIDEKTFIHVFEKYLV